MFGEIKKFLDGLELMAILKVFHRTGASLFSRTGNPCRQVLKDYARADLVSSFVTEVYHLDYRHVIRAIPITLIDGKCVQVVIPGSNFLYLFVQPNNFERH